MFPECIDDYILEDNPVRVIDVFVETFRKKETSTGIKHWFVAEMLLFFNCFMKMFLFLRFYCIYSSSRVFEN